MSTTAHNSRPAPTSRASYVRVAGDLAAGLVPLVATVAGARWRFGLPAGVVWLATALYALVGALILWLGSERLAGRGLGAANRVTLTRATLVLSVAALVPYAGPLGDSGRWWIIGVSTVAMVLDGVDGWVARRTGTSSAFGARFDMELDALLMLVLSVLVWRGGRAGAWVLLIGLLRYLFVAAGWVWPALRGELPPSLRRKAICVVQGVGLLVALGPIVPLTLAGAAAASALATLTYSFAVDVWWLARHPLHS